MEQLQRGHKCIVKEGIGERKEEEKKDLYIEIEKQKRERNTE